MRPSRELTRAGLVAGVLALCVTYVLWPLLNAGGDVLPGRDSVNQYYWELFTRLAFAEGRLPHWNPYHFAGFPHLSDPQTTVFYPPAMLLRWLPPAAFLVAMAALHIWWGGMGALFLARMLRLGWPAATAGAVAAMLGGSAGPWLQNGHLLLLYGASWLPWAIAFAMVSARRSTSLPHPALVVVMAMLFLAGYPQTTLYVGAAVGLYFLYASIWPADHAAVSRVTPLLQLVILALLSAGVTAFQLLPTLGLVGEAARSGGLDYRDALTGAWTFQDLTRVFFPFQGLVDDPPHRLMSDRTIYVGWALTCLVPFAFLDRSRRRVVVFLLIVSGLALALALGDEVGAYRLHYALFPGLRVPGRALFLVTFAAAILGAIGLARFADAAARRDWSTLAGGAALAAVAVSASISTASLQATDGVVPMHGWPWLPVALVAGIIVAGATATLAGARATGTLVVLLVTVDLLGFVRRAPDVVRVASAETIAEWLGPAIPGRVVSMCENEVASGELLAIRRPTLDGLGGFALAGYADWAYVVKTGQRPPGGLYRRISNEGGFPARRDLLNAGHVSTVLSCDDLAIPGLTLVTQGSRVRAYRNEDAWPRAVWTCTPARVSRAEAVDRLVAGRYVAGRRLVRVHYVNIRWAPDATDEQRAAAAARYDLLEGVQHDGTTWRYILANTAEANVKSLLLDPIVEDTHGIDRVSGSMTERPTASSGPRDELLLGMASCGALGTVAGHEDDASDGGLIATVNATDAGYVFVSDAIYPERQALVDGEPVAAERANLAFTAIPVPAGRHQVELRYVPARFYAGIAITVATLGGWLGGLRNAKFKMQNAKSK